jgi:hypothetical protein
MSDKINLKKVTTDNLEAVVEIKLGAGQEDLMASNSIRLLKHSSIPTRAHAPFMLISTSSAF